MCAFVTTVIIMILTDRVCRGDDGDDGAAADAGANLAMIDVANMPE